MAKKTAHITIDEPEPASGSVPLTVDFSGMLTDAYGNGIGGKEINLIFKFYDANGVLQTAVWARPWTNANPFVGAIGVWWAFVTLDIIAEYSVSAEFVGDAEWEGCEP